MPEVFGQVPDMATQRQGVSLVPLLRMEGAMSAMKPDALLSAILSCGIFFALGFFGREVWDYHTKEPVKECTPEPVKKSMKWTE